MSAYAELLKDPRWQRRLLEVLERADWTCQRCGCTSRTLHAHHKHYLKGRKPWEYEDTLIECLCELCHEAAHAELEALELRIASQPTEMLPALRSIQVEHPAMNLTQHPLSAAFPAMPAAEFDELCADIAANGLQQPIVLFESQVLDGWNRYRACLAGGIEPSSRLLPAGVDPVAFVKSANGHRRHLSASQRGLAFAICDQSKWATTGRPEKSAAAADFPVTTARAAKEADVSTRTMSQAKAVVQKAAPEVVEAVKAGAISVETGAKVAQLPAEKQGQALTEAVAPHKPKKPKKEKSAAAADFPEAAELREKLDEAIHSLQEATADNESMAKVFEADDKLAAAMAQNKQLRAEIATLRERVNGLMGEKNEAIRLVKSLQRKLAAVPA